MAQDPASATALGTIWQCRYTASMLRLTALLISIHLLAACSQARGPAVPGGGGGSGNPPPFGSDAGSTQTDGAVPLLACQAIPVVGLTNTIAAESSSELLSFNLAYVFAEWDCNASEPEIRLGMSDTGCSFDSGQRLVMRIASPPTNADGTSIAESAEYVRPSNYDPEGRCGFDEGTFSFDVGFINTNRFKATFTLRSLFLLCEQELEANMLTITGAFDINLGHAYDEACAS